MKTFYIAALATGILSGANALSCNLGMVYCGHTLVNMGWTAKQVMDQTQNWVAKNEVEALQSIYKCEDHWWWTKADLIHVALCVNGCRDNGSGSSDSCY
ncbi:hypothetical protein MCOR25_010953 [Pyricularia grisea]|uniref:Uncharacterized protein n=1 Tax=Pyricularia grisea TaxID=148305 RepID=A0A6P8BJC2_PYRGI|nr:uncharacterized protein PgNI_02130 [Pyricularia grisea]KAI6346856.1 hypothetical protein MCOR25_010953 [Pyricularia grisea]TLD16795.1 hypothetical protein PgNI_02130 [Pyricularia grisea]